MEYSVEYRSGKNGGVGRCDVSIIMTKKDPSLKLITKTQTIDTELQLPHEEEYTKVFTNLFKCNKTSKVNIRQTIESAKELAEIKHGNNKGMTNMFQRLSKTMSYET